MTIAEHVSRVSRGLAAALALATILFLLLPLVAVIPMSFNESAVFEIVPSHPSLAQYRGLLSDAGWVAAFGQSVRVAALVTVLATTMGLLAAVGIVSLSRRVRWAIEALFLAPQIVPTVITASSAYFIFLKLGLSGTVIGVALMQTVIALPFVMVVLVGRLESISPELGLASASLGAGPWRTFRRAILPQMGTALVGAAAFAFHVSFDEVVIALFLSGARNKTLPVKLWDAIQFEVTPLLPAISTLVILVPVLVLLPVLAVQLRGSRIAAGDRVRPGTGRGA